MRRRRILFDRRSGFYDRALCILLISISNGQRTSAESVTALQPGHVSLGCQMVIACTIRFRWNLELRSLVGVVRGRAETYIVMARAGLKGYKWDWNIKSH